MNYGKFIYLFSVFFFVGLKTNHTKNESIYKFRVKGERERGKKRRKKRWRKVNHIRKISSVEDSIFVRCGGRIVSFCGF